jgi:transcription antitermination factor NusG
MEIGNTVEIIQGPLTGLRGLLVNVRKSHRLVLSVRLLCRSVLIEIDPHWVAAHEKSLILSDNTSPEFGISC